MDIRKRLRIKIEPFVDHVILDARAHAFAFHSLLLHDFAHSLANLIGMILNFAQLDVADSDPPIKYFDSQLPRPTNFLKVADIPLYAKARVVNLEPDFLVLDPAGCWVCEVLLPQLLYHFNVGFGAEEKFWLRLLGV